MKQWHERMLRTWVDLVAGDLHDAAAPSLVTVLGMLRDTFEATTAYHWLGDDGAVCNLLCDTPPGWPTAEEADEWPRVKELHPLVEWFAHSQDLRPMTIGRLPARVASAGRIAFIRERLVPEVWQQLSIPVGLVDRSHSAYLLCKSGADFAADRLDLAVQLQPLLMVVEARLAASHHGHDAQTAQVLGLTCRESAVLELVASGLTASSVGARLGCAPRTVSKHLENIYRKLGVRDRLAAALLLERHRPAVRTAAFPGPGDDLPSGFVVTSSGAGRIACD